jgi:hypothetical protein
LEQHALGSLVDDRRLRWVIAGLTLALGLNVDDLEAQFRGGLFMKDPERSAGSKYNPPSQIEDEITKTIDDYTGSVPSAGFLGIAVGAMIVSIVLQTKGNGKWGNFLAQWVPVWLLLGLYTKLAKLEADDSDSSDRGSYFL